MRIMRMNCALALSALHRSMALPLVLLALAGSTGCLYIPPLTHSSGRKDVLALKSAGETRQSLREKLGAPDVVDLPSVQVWEWRENRGTLLWAAGGVAAFPLEGATFKLLARYEGDRVVALETELEPEKGRGEDPPLPPPVERTLLETKNPGPSGSDPDSGPKYYRAWVAPGGKVIAFGRAGDLWLKDSGPNHGLRVADLGKFPFVMNRSDSRGSLSRDGRFLALSCGELILVWDAVESKVVAHLPIFDPDPARKVKNVRGTAIFSPDGEHLAISGLSFSGWSNGARKSLKVLEVGHWKTLWSLEESEHKSFRPHHIQFSPDGTRLLENASFDYGKWVNETGSLYETVTGRRLARSSASAAAFYAEGRRYAALGDELELHETDTGRLLGRIPLRSGSKAQSGVKDGWKDFTAQVLPDGTLLAAGKGVLIRCDLGAFERASAGFLPDQGTASPVEGGAFLQVRLLPLRQRYARKLSEPASEEMALRDWHISPRGDFILEQVLVNRSPDFDVDSFWGVQAQWLLDARTLRTLWVEWPSVEDQGVALFTEDGRFLRTVGSELRLWELPKPESAPSAPTPAASPASPGEGSTSGSPPAP